MPDKMLKKTSAKKYQPTERDALTKAMLKCGPRLDAQRTPPITVRNKGKLSEVSLTIPNPPSAVWPPLMEVEASEQPIQIFPMAL